MFQNSLLTNSLIRPGVAGRPLYALDLTTYPYPAAIQDAYTGPSGKTYYDENGLLSWAPEQLQPYTEDDVNIYNIRCTIADNGDRTPNGHPAYLVTATEDNTYGCYLYRSSSAMQLSIGEHVYISGVFKVTPGTIAGPGWTDNGTVTLNVGIDSNGAIQQVNGGNGASAEIEDYGVEDLGDGWFRVWLEISTYAEGSDWARWTIIPCTTGDSFLVGEMLCTRDKTMEYIPNAVFNPKYRARPISYHPVTSQNLGLLLESESTNLIGDSIECGGPTPSTRSGWADQNNMTIVDRAVTGPDGKTNSAFTFTKNDSATRRFHTFTAVAATQYAMSYYCKAGTHDVVGISSFQTSGAGRLFTTTFDLTNESFTIDTDPLGVIDNQYFEKLPNGWYRYVLVFTSDATKTTSFDIHVGSYSVSGSNQSAHFYGGQVEAGPRASSFIATKISTATARATEGLEGPVSMPDRITQLIDMDGTDDHVSLGAPILPASDPFELRFKLRLAEGWSPAGTEYFLGQRAVGDSDNTCIVGVPAGGGSLRLGIGTSVQDLAGLSHGKTYQCTLSRSGDTFTLSAEGVGSVDITRAGHVINPDSSFEIGGILSISGHFMQGSVWDLRLSVNGLPFEAHAGTNPGNTDESWKSLLYPVATNKWFNRSGHLRRNLGAVGDLYFANETQRVRFYLPKGFAGTAGVLSAFWNTAYRIFVQSDLTLNVNGATPVTTLTEGEEYEVEVDYDSLGGTTEVRVNGVAYAITAPAGTASGGTSFEVGTRTGALGYYGAIYEHEMSGPNGWHWVDGGPNYTDWEDISGKNHPPTSSHGTEEGAVIRNSVPGPIANGTVSGAPGTYNLNLAEWTMLLDGRLYRNDAYSIPFQISDGTTGSRMMVDVGVNSVQPRGIVTTGGVNQMVATLGGAMVLPADAKIALGVAPDSGAISMTGLTQSLDTGALEVPVGQDTFNIPLVVGGVATSLFVKSFKLWKGRKTNAQLEKLVGN